LINDAEITLEKFKISSISYTKLVKLPILDEIELDLVNKVVFRRKQLTFLNDIDALYKLRSKDGMKQLSIKIKGI
jgi:hypothetical protein